MFKEPASVGIVSQFTRGHCQKGGLAVVTAAMISWIRHVRGEYCVINFSPFVLVMEDGPDQNFSGTGGVSLKCKLTG